MNTNDAGQPAEESRQSSAGVSQSEESSSEVWKTPLPPAETSSWQAELLPKFGAAALIIVAAMIGSWLGVPAGKSPLGFMFPAFAGIIVLVTPPALLLGLGWLFDRLYRDQPAPSAPPPADHWWLCFRGRATGPFSFGLLAEAFQRQDFSEDALVARVGSHEWRRRADWPEWSSEPHGPLDPSAPNALS